MASLPSILASHTEKIDFTQPITLISAALVLLTSIATMSNPFAKDNFPIEGKHAFVAGASEGLGLSIAVFLARHGASLTLVSRSPSKLAEALKQVEAVRKSPSQLFTVIPADLFDYDAAGEALLESARAHGGQAPDYVFQCVGGAGEILDYFVRLTKEQLEKGLNWNYRVSLNVSHHAARLMASQQRPGKIIFVASLLGIWTMPCYAAYSPGKHATRGLAETLRVELAMYNIGVHIYFPGSIQSPGFEVEQRGKPQLAKTIEAGDEVQHPDALTKKLIQALKRGDPMITTDFVSDIYRQRSKGGMPGRGGWRGWILDPLMNALAGIVAPGVRIWVNGLVKETKKKTPEVVRPEPLLTVSAEASK